VKSHVQKKRPWVTGPEPLVGRKKKSGSTGKTVLGAVNQRIGKRGTVWGFARPIGRGTKKGGNRLNAAVEVERRGVTAVFVGRADGPVKKVRTVVRLWLAKRATVGLLRTKGKKSRPHGKRKRLRPLNTKRTMRQEREGERRRLAPRQKVN